jgi:type IV secretion system protein VirD4
MKQSRPLNVFYGHIIVGVLFILLGTWAATQYVAWALGYQPQLGHPALIAKGYPLYEPWAWMLWAYHFEPYAPHVFEMASRITYASFFLMFATMVVLAVFRSKRTTDAGSYGTARWASNKELQGVGLLEERGVILAQTNDAVFRSMVKADASGDITVQWVMERCGQDLLRHHGPEHVFCFAPTRSGKGVGLVIPTLLSWTGSCVVYDIKKENWAATAGWRRSFSHCLRFEPTSPASVRFNPLLEIRRGLYEVRDAQNIADILVDPEGSLERRDHWDKTAHTIFVGAILHILYTESDKSIAGLVRFLSDPERTIEDTLHYMLDTRHLPEGPHPVVASCAREALNKSPNELSGVISTAMTFLGLFRDPIIAQNTAVSDFHVEDLMNSDRPVSLYIVVPPSDIDRTKPLIRLILNQMGRRLTEKMTFDQVRNGSGESSDTRDEQAGKTSARQSVSRHRMLLMLDEFPSLGRLSFFETELAYLAGYGIKCFMIAQSLNQIEKAYGQNNSILDNSHVRVTYGALDERTAKRISDLLGQATEKRRQLNFAGSRLSPWLGHVMESEQESPRPLLTPGEILQLPGDDALLIVGGIPPYRAKKVMYYQDERFRDRAWLPAPDNEQEQRAELFKSRVWENAWELQSNALGHDHFADTESGNCTTISDQDNGGLKPSITKVTEASLLELDVCEDEHDLDDIDEFPLYEELNGATSRNPERQQDCHQDRQEDDAVGMNRKLELTRTPDGGRLPL